MAIITYPLNNIEYSAEDAELFHCTRTSGVFSAENEFVASVTGTDNNVTIGTGIAWIRNSKFSGKVVANKTAVVLDMGIADGAYSRIDAIVIQFDANANKTSIIVKKGTAASNPIPPQVVRTEALYELHIYHVRRPAGATAVYAENVTDLRQDKTYCGIMFDDVTIVDGDAFMAKETYDPDGAVATAGGIPAYVATNAPKVPLSSSVTSTSTTTAANSAAVKTAYDRATEVSRSIPQLSSSVDSDSTITAANSYAVKKAYNNAAHLQYPSGRYANVSDLNDLKQPGIYVIGSQDIANLPPECPAVAKIVVDAISYVNGQVTQTVSWSSLIYSGGLYSVRFLEYFRYEESPWQKTKDISYERN